MFAQGIRFVRRLGPSVRLGTFGADCFFLSASVGTPGSPQPAQARFDSELPFSVRHVQAAPQACIPPPANLSAWFPLDEAGGNTARDIQGSLVGTVQGGGTGPQSQGRVGIARTFDGVDDAVVVPDNPALDIGGGNFTIDAWVKPTFRDVGGPTHPIISKIYVPADAPLGYRSKESVANQPELVIVP